MLESDETIQGEAFFVLHLYVVPESRKVPYAYFFQPAFEQSVQLNLRNDSLCHFDSRVILAN